MHRRKYDHAFMKDDESEFDVVRIERDQSVACVAVSTFITLALMAAAFRPEAQAERASKAVLEHRALLGQLQQVLQSNTAELAQDEAALATLRKGAQR